MDFVSQVRKNLEGKLRIEDGNCGTTHKVLKEISLLGGRAVTWEQPDGVRSSILDDKGNVVGRGEGITWPPAILFALVEGGFFPKQIESELTKSLQCILDMEKVADIYGYGRVVTPVAAAYNEVWKNGGRVAIRRNSWGVEVVFIDKDDREMAVGPISYCPTCGTAATIPRAPELAARIKEELKDKRNITTDVRMDTYITALSKKDGELIGKGIGTVCAFSSLLYAAAKCIQLRSQIEVERV